MPNTVYDKIWKAHLVESKPNYPHILYIDKHFIHEVTSPQAFQGLRKRGIKVFRPDKIVATMDHNVPTENLDQPIADPLSRNQIEMLEKNCKEFGIQLYGLKHPYQGIVHVIGPELGITQPGMTIVCGDSHTSTHGAFGCIAFGIGTSEVEQVLATQCLLQNKSKVMKIIVDGKLSDGVLSKDIILYIIAQISSSGASGFFVEYAGSTIENLSMEGRMTICNMSIEMGAKGGLIAPDQKTFDYIKGRKFAPKDEKWHAAVAYWKTLYSDPDAVFDKTLHFNAQDIKPMITYGTNPGMGITIDQCIPSLDQVRESEKNNFNAAIEYMGLVPGENLQGKKIDYVFIGSCTNARIEDLRLVASVIKGEKKSPHIKAFIIPGSSQVARQAEKEGLVDIFTEAGFNFRSAGCSACLGMNEDKIPKGKYCVSTSNRNFEGRQGPGARTLLVSPLTAALSSIKGEIPFLSDFLN